MGKKYASGWSPLKRPKENGEQAQRSCKLVLKVSLELPSSPTFLSPLSPHLQEAHVYTNTDTHGGGLFPACHSRWSETSDPDRIFQQVNLLVSIIHTEVRLMLLMFFVVKPYDKVQQQVIAR